MESVLKKVVLLEEEFLKLKDKADKLVQKNAKIETELGEKEDRLKSFEESLLAREKVIKPIEDVVDFKRKAEELMSEAKKKMVIVGKEEDRLSKLKEDTLKWIAGEKDKIRKEYATIEDEKKSIRKGYEQLNKAKENAEKDIIKSVATKIGK